MCDVLCVATSRNWGVVCVRGVLITKRVIVCAADAGSVLYCAVVVHNNHVVHVPWSSYQPFVTALHRTQDKLQSCVHFGAPCVATVAVLVEALLAMPAVADVVRTDVAWVTACPPAAASPPAPGPQLLSQHSPVHDGLPLCAVLRRAMQRHEGEGRGSCACRILCSRHQTPASATQCAARHWRGALALPTSCSSSTQVGPSPALALQQALIPFVWRGWVSTPTPMEPISPHPLTPTPHRHLVTLRCPPGVVQPAWPRHSEKFLQGKALEALCVIPPDAVAALAHVVMLSDACFDVELCPPSTVQHILPPMADGSRPVLLVRTCPALEPSRRGGASTASTRATSVAVDTPPDVLLFMVHPTSQRLRAVHLPLFASAPHMGSPMHVPIAASAHTKAVVGGIHAIPTRTSVVAPGPPLQQQTTMPATHATPSPSGLDGDATSFLSAFAAVHQCLTSESLAAMFRAVGPLRRSCVDKPTPQQRRCRGVWSESQALAAETAALVRVCACLLAAVCDAGVRSMFGLFVCLFVCLFVLLVGSCPAALGDQWQSPWWWCACGAHVQASKEEPSLVSQVMLQQCMSLQDEDRAVCMSHRARVCVCVCAFPPCCVLLPFHS